MRDLSMEELGHVYGAGGKGHPYKCKKEKKDKSHSYGSYSSDKKKKHCYPKKPPVCTAR